MEEFIKVVGYFALLFAASVAGGWLVTTVIARLRGLHLPEPYGVLHIRSEHQVYRSKFVEKDPDGWWISAPLCRDSYVPLRVGDELSVIAPARRGVYRFKTTVKRRSLESHRLLIAPPAQSAFSDRREEPRFSLAEPQPVRLEGEEAKLLDLSTWGARVESPKAFKRGERLKLEFPGIREEVYAWALDAVTHGETSSVRLRFEEVFDLTSYKKTAPVA